jgi:hypothetical protein
VRHQNTGSYTSYEDMQSDNECDNFMVLRNNVPIVTDQMHSCLFAIHKFSDYSAFEYPMP